MISTRVSFIAIVDISFIVDEVLIQRHRGFKLWPWPQRYAFIAEMLTEADAEAIKAMPKNEALDALEALCESVETRLRQPA